MARKTAISRSSDLPVVVIADQPDLDPGTIEKTGTPQDGVAITREEFVDNYLFSSPERKMAAVTLPDQVLSVGEWRALWRSTLNSPAP